MKKVILTVLIIMSIVTTSTVAAFKPKTEYTMQVNVTPAYVWGQAAQKWADLVRERTNGLINIKPYYASSLLAGKQTTWFQAVSEGSIDFVVDSTINAAPVVKELNLFSLPFFINTYENLDKILNGETGKRLVEIMDKLGVVTLAWGENGFRQLTNSKKPIRKPEDMRGMKFRVVGSPIFIDIFRALGADAVSMNWADAVTAFQQGAVDGQENPYQVLLGVKIWEYHKFVTNWNYLVDPLIFGVSKEVWNSFPDDIKQIIRQSAIEAAEWERAMARRGLDGEVSIKILQEKFKENPTPLSQVDYVKQQGMTVIDLTPEEIEAFKKATQSVYDKWVAVIGKSLYEMALKDMSK